LLLTYVTARMLRDIFSVHSACAGCSDTQSKLPAKSRRREAGLVGAMPHMACRCRGLSWTRGAVEVVICRRCSPNKCRAPARSHPNKKRSAASRLCTRPSSNAAVPCVCSVQLWQQKKSVPKEDMWSCIFGRVRVWLWSLEGFECGCGQWRRMNYC
jgi:hypothetical protein